MTREQVERAAKEAAKRYSETKKVAKRPETQFLAGVHWLWELLKGAKDVAYYEEVLRAELTDRIGVVERWKESIITDTAKLMARRDRLEATIEESGDLLVKYDKNLNPYQEANPLHAHLKEVDRSIGIQREHLGLSNKANPERIKADAKKGIDEGDPIMRALTAVKNDLDAVPDFN